jgi:choline dehydrogenase-like flavoprotein
MFVDARQIADDDVVRTELCIIGAGAAGITIARALAGSGHGIVVLESGGLESDAATTALNEGDITGLPLDPVNPLPLDQTRLRYFGGTTGHWSGFCRPLEPVDFERRPHVNLSGWPFGRETIDSYYERAARIVGIGRFEFDWRWWDEKYRAGRPFLGETAFRSAVSQISQRRNFGQVYKADLERARDVRVLLHANATNLALSADSQRLDHVAVATLTGRRFAVTARAYVLATGGIEVPRVLLASRDVRPAGVGNEHDLVGRHFMEHLNTLVGGYAIDVPRAAFSLYTPTTYPAGYPDDPDAVVRVFASLVPTRRTIMQQGLLSIEVSLIGGGGLESFSRDKWDGVVLDDVKALTAVATDRPVGTAGATRVLCEQEPNPESRVTLSTEQDALGIPHAALHWQLSRLDRESIIRSIGLLGTEMGRAGVGRMQVGAVARPVFVATSIDPKDLADLDFTTGTGFHHMGTARMSADPARGVVDADCRVHTVANLYIGGSAVFPTSGSSPPTLTITALALRLADHLRDKVLA